MKKLLILSGKGGTGKTTTAAAFIEFASAKAFADCDVDAPNLHLVAGAGEKFEKSNYFGSQKAEIDPHKCFGCGKCQENCRFNAVKKLESKYETDVLACEGCGVCVAVCPCGAVSMKDDVAGELLLHRGDKTFSTAKLRIGRGNSGKLVTEVKAALFRNASGEGMAIIDGSPGIGCPVIASMNGADMVLIVTEPSLSGISDMKRVLETARIFKIKTAVCVNKADTCPENTQAIEQYCKENKIAYTGTIPYDKTVVQAVNRGMSVARINCPAKDALKNIFRRVMELMKEDTGNE